MGGGAIPPLPYGKQGFPQGNSHPQSQTPFFRRKDCGERFPKGKASNREVACDRVFATPAGADLSETRERNARVQNQNQQKGILKNV